MSYLVGNPEDRFSHDKAHRSPLTRCRVVRSTVLIEKSRSYWSGHHPIYEPRHDKTCLRGFRPGMAQTGLLSYKDKLES